MQFAIRLRRCCLPLGLNPHQLHPAKHAQPTSHYQACRLASGPAHHSLARSSSFAVVVVVVVVVAAAAAAAAAAVVVAAAAVVDVVVAAAVAAAAAWASADLALYLASCCVPRSPVQCRLEKPGRLLGQEHATIGRPRGACCGSPAQKNRNKGIREIAARQTIQVWGSF